MNDVDQALHRLIAEERLGAVLTAVEGDRVGERVVYDYDEGVVAGTLVRQKRCRRGDR